MYSGSDSSRTATNWFMEKWRLYSSSDLVTWNLEYTLEPANTYIHKPYPLCFAGDGAMRNGTYYWYFAKATESSGVASSSSPGGPYIDALGKPIITRSTANTAAHDITAFIDDDSNRTPYLIWGSEGPGQGGVHIAQLNTNMISLAEKPKLLVQNGLPKGGDGNFMHKHNGIYYLTSQGGHYSVSTNLYGPYTYVDIILPGWSDHPTYFSRQNQDYFIFDNTDKVYSSPGHNYRTAYMTYISYKNDGKMVADKFTINSPLGVAQYDATWPKIEAENYFAASQNTKLENSSGFEVSQLTNNMYLYFPKIRNLQSNMFINFCVSSSNTTGGTIEIHQNSTNGPLLGSCVVSDTGSWTAYQTNTSQLTNDAGTQNLYLVFKGSGPELMRLDWFKFTTNSCQ